MKKKLIIGTTVLIIVIGLAYWGLMRMFAGPLYVPGDLTNQENYEHLLKPVQEEDLENYFVLNDGIKLHYFTKGAGRPVLIIHGGPGIPYRQAWKGLDSLTTHFKFYYYDQRGCGQSTRPFDRFESSNFYENMMALNDNLGLPAQLADIEQIRRKLGEEKLIIIGHSFGGFMASLYATEFPDKVEQLILVTPAELLKMPSESGGLYDEVKKRLPKDKVADFEAYMAKLLDFSNMFEKSEAELVELNKGFIPYYNLATNNSVPEEAMNPEIGGWLQNAVFMSMGKEHDYTEAMEGIKVPTLVVCGEEDMIPLSSVQLYLEHIPNSQLKTIPKATHFCFDEQPTAFGEIAKEALLK